MRWVRCPPHHLCEDSTINSAVTGTTWAGTALTGFRSVTPGDCPVDSSRRTKPTVSPPLHTFCALRKRKIPTSRDGFDKITNIIHCMVVILDRLVFTTGLVPYIQGKLPECVPAAGMKQQLSFTEHSGGMPDTGQHRISRLAYRKAPMLADTLEKRCRRRVDDYLPDW